MSLEMRYDALLCDMLSLLQEGLLRFFTAKPIDLDKFKHYFNHCFGRMSTLEDEFHQLKLKFTHQISKLREFCQKKPEQPILISNGSKSKQSQKNENSRLPQNRYEAGNKTTLHSEQLVSIEQEVVSKRKQKRVETAGYQRVQKPTVQSANGRPMTGRATHIEKHKVNLSKTLDYASNVTEYRQPNSNGQNTSKQKPKISGRASGMMSPSQIESRRMNFYSQLEKQREDNFQPLLFNDNKFLSIFKKRAKSQQKWNKISQLI